MFVTEQTRDALVAARVTGMSCEEVYPTDERRYREVRL